MPKKTSTKTPTSDVVAPATPVVETASSVTPVVEKKVRKPKAPKSETDVATHVVQPVVEAVDSSVDAAVVAGSELETPLADQSVEFIAKLQQASLIISSLKSEYRALEKKWSREIKVAQKKSVNRKRKTQNRAPSGFVKPTKISDELASFLGKENGTEMARTDVTREINTYIRANNLQDKANGRKINPDNKLAVLLKLKKNDELTYFNLQKYMSPHFAKAVKSEVVTTA
jgi:upstream activation factor subunit UAF30